jgi:hypothetical protein
MPKLGLGTGIGRSGIVTPGVVTDSLVMKHMYPAGAVQPVSDGAAYFDSTDDYIDCGASNSIITGTNVTYACWVNVSDADQARLITSQKGSGSTNLSLGIHNNNGANVEGYITLIVWDGSSNHRYVNFDADINDNKWHHIVATTTSSAQNLYFDGALVATQSHTFGNSVSSNIFTLGAINGTSEFLGGYMANVGVWNRVLTQAEIKSIMFKQYADLTTTEKTSLVSWWNLDTAYDSFVHNEAGGSTSIENIAFDNHHGGGNIYGSELISNGDFSNGTTGWSNQSNSWDDAFEVDSQNRLHLQASSVAYPQVNSTGFSITGGKTYRIQYTATNVSSTHNMFVGIYDNASVASAESPSDYSEQITGTETVDTYFYATDTETVYLKLWINNSGTPSGEAYLSNVSVTEVNGNTGSLK